MSQSAAPRPGAEPFRHDGANTGVLLCHGFTGSPASLRPWADALAAAGHSVRLPLLPGHGTSWRNLADTCWDDWLSAVEDALVDLVDHCDHVFVMGLSMGGALTLRLAQTHGDSIRGIALVNPSVMSTNRTLLALPVLRFVVPSVAGIVNDIKLPGGDEVGYDRLPLQPLYSLTRAWPVVRRDLPKVTCPTLLMHSHEDHVVEPANSRIIATHLGSDDLTEIELLDSYHVATLDNDQQLIIDSSLDFIDRIVAKRNSANQS